MADESILGLLLRVHKECAAQMHGEMYVHRNVSASNCYETAIQSIETAIRQVGFAEMYIARQGDRKAEK